MTPREYRHHNVALFDVRGRLQSLEDSINQDITTDIEKVSILLTVIQISEKLETISILAHNIQQTLLANIIARDLKFNSTTGENNG